MSQQNINVGTVPNDGTGDPIRTAMIKVQNNFSEFYAALAPNLSTNNVTAANNLTVTANLYATTISTVGGSGANLYFDPDGTADVVFTNQTEVWVLSNAQSTSVSTGALVVNGGIGVANSIVSGNNVLVTNLVNAASHTVGSAFVANGSGVYTTGTVNATSHTIGTNFVANSTTVASNGYITAANGFLSNGNYANAYTDGIVVDYVTNNGRISVGAVDNLSFYTGGIGSSLAASVNTSGLYVTGLVNTTLVTTGGGGGSATGGITVNSSVITIGNTTVNVSTNSTHFYAGNSTYYGFGNSTAESLVTPTQNMVILSNTSSGVITLSVGNSTVNAYGNSSVEVIANSSGNLVLTATTITLSNASANVIVGNTTGLYVNTNVLNLGTSNNNANGYTYLPNGIKMNWGWVSANSSTAGAITFSSAYTTNAYVVTATSNSATATYQAAVVSWTKTGANVVTANATSTNVFWTAIGT